MSSHPALTPRSDSPRNKRPAAPDAPSFVRVEAAANPEQPKSEFSFYGDPLFGMAIASVILFAVFAALMAFA